MSFKNIISKYVHYYHLTNKEERKFIEQAILWRHRPNNGDLSKNSLISEA